VSTSRPIPVIRSPASYHERPFSPADADTVRRSWPIPSIELTPSRRAVAVVAALGAVLAMGLVAAPLAAQRRPVTGRPAVEPAPAGWGRFIAAFDGYTVADGVVGGRVMVLRQGRVVGDHRVGLGDRERGTPPAPDAVYHWASITKTLTAIAIMQLRDRGRLSLDDPITRWVPELRLIHDPFGPVDRVTLRMLLSHSGGFQNPTWPYGEGRPWEPFEPTRWEQLVAMMPYQEIAFPPGTKFSYSNPGFVYLGRVIESVTGDPWAVYIQKNIWTPLGLTRSFVGTSPYHLAPLRAASYTIHQDDGRTRTEANPREFDPGITIPNSGWNAPMSDLVTYLGFLSGAMGDDSAQVRRGAAVLRRASLEEMWRPVVPLGTGAPDEAFGLSFYLYRRSGTTVVGHTGEQSGFRSFFFLDPATTTGVIGILNTTNEARPEQSNAGWDRLIHQAVALVAP
jgi:CubicO group peptidase (beta-lactamase class C family)